MQDPPTPRTSRVQNEKATFILRLSSKHNVQQHLFEENKPNKKATIAKERMKPKSKSKKKSAVLTLDEYREKSKKKEAVVKTSEGTSMVGKFRRSFALVGLGDETGKSKPFSNRKN
eukprot:m.19725 g.19725  ORF g.19725 m.19725 type:complete len:116 (+) comp6659_c0_seq1:49-396(+)